MPPTATASSRHSADERRDQVLDAALEEFAERGYHAASTAAIAKRAGISQPYIYALFPNKQALFVAAYDRTTGLIRETFMAAARGATGPDDALARMGETYADLIADRRLLMCQMQSFAVGDPEIREHVARRFKELVQDVRRTSGATPGQVSEFLSHGMLCNVATALDLPELLDALWPDKA